MWPALIGGSYLLAVVATVTVLISNAPFGMQIGLSCCLVSWLTVTIARLRREIAGLSGVEAASCSVGGHLPSRPSVVVRTFTRPSRHSKLFIQSNDT